MRVLIADAEKNIRDSIAAYISGEGIETATAADGAAARALLESEAFDGLVLDLRMPKIDGLELLRWLREAGPDVPAIMISAYGDVSDAVQAMKLGARDYLVKPFDPEELLLRLKRLLAESAGCSSWPPLRERREDIPRLADYFIEKLNRERGRRIRGFDQDDLSRLRAYILCSDDIIGSEDPREARQQHD